MQSFQNLFIFSFVTILSLFYNYFSLPSPHPPYSATALDQLNYFHDGWVNHNKWTKNTKIIWKNIEVFMMFSEAKWMPYFQILQGFDKSITMEFALSFKLSIANVWGLCIWVTEDSFAWVTGIPKYSKRYLEWRIMLSSTRANFMFNDETMKGAEKEVQHTSFRKPWSDISLCIYKFLTCEGMCSFLYGYHFKLLNHLWHKQLIYILYFLLRSLQLMLKMVPKS